MKSEATPLAIGRSPIRLLPLVPTGSPAHQSPLFLTAASAASALFALQHHADASIIYRGPQNVTATLGGSFGTADRSISFGIVSVARRHGSHTNIGIAGVYLPYGFFLANASGGLKKLGAGAVISAGQNFTNPFGQLRGFRNGVATAGTWASAQTGFAAFKSTDGNLGWLRLEWTNTDGNPDPNTITFVDGAYDNTPGESILAGQTSSVPEPGTTALLALAGAGAAFLRRSRKFQGDRQAA